MTTNPKDSGAVVPPSHPPYLWWAGRMLAWDDATVHLTQMGWPAISMVFEGIRAYWNEEQQQLFVFRLNEHLRRFSQSMRFMRMDPRHDREELTRAILELLSANGHREDAYCAPMAYLAENIPGYLAASSVPGEAYITTRRAPSNLGSGKVSHCCVSTWARISDNSMPARAKAITNYQNSRYISTEAQLNGFDNGIVLNDRGKVAEGAYACIFIVRDGVASTPPVTAGILESITRDSVIQLLREQGVTVQEREIDRTELYYADEAFFCGTFIEIEPIVSVDHYPMGDGSAGPITTALQQRFMDVIRGRDRGHWSWLTPVYAPVNKGVAV